MNRKTKIILMITIAMVILVSVTIGGFFISEGAITADFSAKNIAPSLKHPFGTDWMGRDMLFRTLKGLSMSMIVGIVSSTFSAIMAVIIGMIAGTMPGWVDALIVWIIDLVMGIPHLVLLILISFAVGRGFKGIMIGITLTHWTSLARLVRGEVLQVKNEHYIKLSSKLGKSKLYIMKNHILPHVIPQFIIGLVLLFPHAILHEASITFLGFGLPPEQPAIGIILSESMQYLSSGMWWLAFFPGIMLLLIVLLFHTLGDNIGRLIDPYSAQE